MSNPLELYMAPPSTAVFCLKSQLVVLAGPDSSGRASSHTVPEENRATPGVQVTRPRKQVKRCTSLQTVNGGKTLAWRHFTSHTRHGKPQNSPFRLLERVFHVQGLLLNTYCHLSGAASVYSSRLAFFSNTLVLNDLRKRTFLCKKPTRDLCLKQWEKASTGTYRVSGQHRNRWAPIIVFVVGSAAP